MLKSDVKYLIGFIEAATQQDLEDSEIVAYINIAINEFNAEFPSGVLFLKPIEMEYISQPTEPAPPPTPTTSFLEKPLGDLCGGSDKDESKPYYDQCFSFAERVFLSSISNRVIGAIILNEFEQDESMPFFNKARNFENKFVKRFDIDTGRNDFNALIPEIDQVVDMYEELKNGGVYK